MNKSKVAYWISTVLLCMIYGSGAIMYILQRPLVEEGFGYFGYPAYLVSVLIVAKIAAPLTILTRFSVQLSDLAYAGMLFHLLLAISAHLSVVDMGFVPALLALALLAVSFLTQNAGRKVASPNVPLFAFGKSPKILKQVQG
ncbi:DoxX family protein [Devosia sp. FJ2-5-3]|uniref:DoxX family protein n=1 Tax=Devosia sp. FJ2-5-3 TaxID=2976680 RepID=UPI0023D7B97A|nr:DoxX family protein [Devosia sp. FJ2-5-3]WEJ59605.1 DoxX family protein [Devosia sp. FJ2-5-3]